MAQQIICPTCRSILLPKGHIAPPWENTPSLQILKCPIEGTPISIPADQAPGVIPIGYIWDSLEVIKNNYSGIGWEQVTARVPELKINAENLGKSNPNLYPTAQEIPEQAGAVVGSLVGSVAGGAGGAVLGFLSNVGAPVIAIGLIVLYIMLKKD